MNNSETRELLILLLVFCMMILFSLIGILVFIKLRKKQKETSKDSNGNVTDVPTKQKVFKSYTKESIYNFMEFDKVEDNMIIQKNGKRFLMVVECKGVNYDLMSEVEKVAVEESFLQFLNSLRHPIQIYVQSRTINLTGSIQNYRKKVDEYKAKLDRMNMEYNQLKDNITIKPEVLQRYNFELVKQRNLYEYGVDIIENTQKMNLNKNILSKKYYVIVPYYAEEDEILDKEDIKNIAFSELYTKAQSVIRTLAACEVSSKILNSTELINLLYVAYNRDESETIDIEKVLRAGCEDIYSTAPDVFENKIKVLDELIAKKAQERAEEAYKLVKTKKQILAETKEQSIEELIDEIAKNILDENVQYIGSEDAEESKKVIDQTKEIKGGKGANEKKTTRKAKTA